MLLKRSVEEPLLISIFLAFLCADMQILDHQQYNQTLHLQNRHHQSQSQKTHTAAHNSVSVTL